MQIILNLCSFPNGQNCLPPTTLMLITVSCSAPQTDEDILYTRTEEINYLVMFSFTRFSVRMSIVSWRYFMRGDTAWEDVSLKIR